MENKLFVGYYRVSTKDQGKSGLGLDSQRTSVRDFVQSVGTMVAEFQDIESGASNSRQGIRLAMLRCAETGSTLVVKEMSRISRGGFKTMVELEEAGIPFIESTAPNDPEMVKGIKFVLAKDEREKISIRTKGALAEIKEKLARGEEHISKSGNVVKSLGSSSTITAEARKKSCQVRKEKAYNNPDNKKAGALILALKKAGGNYYTIAQALNDAGFKTSRGKEFTQVQVNRLYRRYA